MLLFCLKQLNQITNKMETYSLIQELLRQIAKDAQTENINENYRKALYNTKDALLALQKFY